MAKESYITKNYISGSTTNLKKLELLFLLIKRNLTVRYFKQSYLGIAWIFIKPATQILVYTLVFSYFVKIPLNTEIPYALIVTSGLIIWMSFTTAILDMSQCYVNNRSLVLKIYFPRYLIPLSYLASCILEMLVMLFIFLIFFLYQGLELPKTSFFIIMPILFSVAFSFFLGSSIGLYHAYRRDFAHLTTLFLQIFLFLSPVIYTYDLIPEKLRYFYFLNPLASMVEIFRFISFKNYIFEYKYLIPSLFSFLLLIIINIISYKKLEKNIADNL